MKKIYLYLILILSFTLGVNSQVQLNQSFTAPFNVAGNGWARQNNSTPLGVGTWTQGNTNAFFANSGGNADFYGAAYDCQGTTTGSISCWLVTPTVNLTTGGIFKFATRTFINPSSSPDRLEVRMSLGTGTGAIGAGAAAVGTFTNVALTINPNLTQTGYPDAWTFYTIVLSGITTPTVGRFAFRYWVPDGGINGQNALYIGVDDVTYTASCTPPSVLITPAQVNICAGGSATLTGSGATSFTWNTGSTATNIVVSPSSTTSYTLSSYYYPGCTAGAVASVIVTNPPNVVAPSVNSCPGGNATLTASGASSYLWSNGQTGSVITVPSNAATYTVTGTDPPNCSSAVVVSVVPINFVLSAPSISTCVGITPTLTASGANSYSWSTGQTGAFITVPSTSASYTVTGFVGACSQSTVVSVSISSLQISAPSITTCPGVTPTLTASGANTYNWSTGQTGSVITVPSVSASYTVIGTSGPNCSDTQVLSVLITTFEVTAPSITTCPSTNVNLTASGASTYSWSNGATGPMITVPSTPATYTVTGMYGEGCSDTKTVSVFSKTFLFTSTSELTVCPGVPVIIGAGGANSYVWSTGATSSSIAVTPVTSTAYVVTGNDGTCNESKKITLIVELNLFAPNFTTCAGTAATLIATGAQSYSWSTGATSSVIVVPATKDSVYTIKGVTGACSIVNTVSVTIGKKLSVNTIQNCVGGTAILSAYGASSYTWYPIMEYNSVVIVVPTGPTNYTLAGASGTCVGSQVISISYCAGVEELSSGRVNASVFPNPFQNEIKITDAYGSVQLINMTGELIYTSSVEGSLVIPTETLQSGLYFIMLNNNSNTERKVYRMIKN